MPMLTQYEASYTGLADGGEGNNENKILLAWAAPIFSRIFFTFVADIQVSFTD